MNDDKNSQKLIELVRGLEKGVMEIMALKPSEVKWEHVIIVLDYANKALLIQHLIELWRNLQLVLKVSFS